MTTQEALTGVIQLWQITQTANQPATVHMECQKVKDLLLAIIKEAAVFREAAHIKELKDGDAKAAVPEGSSGGSRGPVLAASDVAAPEDPSPDVRRDSGGGAKVRGKGSS
jgi:hypothetical protein